MKLNSYLIAFALAIASPVVLFGAAMVYWTAHLYRESLQVSMQHTATALGLAVDAKLEGSRSAAQAIAMASELDNEDIAGFYTRARKLSERHLGWVALFDSRQHQVFNTRFPLGPALPDALNRSQIQQALDTDRDLVSDLFLAGAVNELTLAIYVPVSVNSGKRYVMAFAFDPRFITELLLEQQLTEDTYATVVDGNGRVIADSRDHTAHLGHDIPAWLRRATRHSDALIEGGEIDGMRVVATSLQMRSANWRLIIIAPATQLGYLWSYPVQFVIVAGATLLLMSVVLGAILRRRISTDVANLLAAADSIRTGEPPQPTGPPSVDEFGAVRTVLDRSFAAIKDREQERDRRHDAEAKRYVAEAENRAKDEFIRSLSHELRSPTQALLNWVRLLHEKPDDPRTVQRAAQVTERNLTHLSRLINDLLDISSMVSGRVNLQLQLVDLHQLARDAVQTYALVAEEKSQRLEYHGEAHTCVMGDRSRLHQIIVNLLTNAIKFAGDGGHIAVTVKQSGDNAVLCVEDNGKGIEPEALPRVFERFWQADQGEHGGLGLGLAIVKHIAEAHHGTVSVSSKGLSCGATFTVTLALVRSESEHLTHNA